MFRSWRSRIHEAEMAFAAGRLQKASRLISEGRLAQYLPGQRLVAEVVAALAQRARSGACHGDLTMAWSDMDAARRLGAARDELESAQQVLLNQSISWIDQFMAAGETGEATKVLKELARRRISSDEVRKRDETATHVEAAKKLSREGRFSAAERQLAAAASLSPELDSIHTQRQLCQTNRLLSNVLTEQLRQALIEDDWLLSMSLADRMLELAPESQLARDTRRRAAHKVRLEQQAELPASNLADTQYWTPATAMNQRATGRTACSTISETTVMKRPEPRFLLWVDAIGGFLVCLADQVMIGQAVPDTDVDIPILGDLSRRHAQLTREGEDYLIEPIGDVCVNGRQVKDTRLLSDGDEIELGKGVLLRYRRPHALSATARLELVSRHRTQPSADCILLMAESCVLGPHWNNHVVCRDWSEDVVLYRHGDSLYCRAFQSLQIDGKCCEGPGQIKFNSRVAGDDFSMSLEEI